MRMSVSVTCATAVRVGTTVCVYVCMYFPAPFGEPSRLIMDPDVNIPFQMSSGKPTIWPVMEGIKWAHSLPTASQPCSPTMRSATWRRVPSRGENVKQEYLVYRIQSNFACHASSESAIAIVTDWLCLSPYIFGFRWEVTWDPYNTISKTDCGMPKDAFW